MTYYSNMRGGVTPNIYSTNFGTTYAPEFVTKQEHKEMLDRITEIEKRLFILQSNRYLEEKYPALKEAYEAYKLIEGLIEHENQKTT